QSTPHLPVAGAAPRAAAAVARQHPPSALLPELLEAVKMALRSLRVNLFRTALTLLGVVFGVAAVVAMLAIGDGSKAQVLQRISSMGSDLLIVRPGGPGVRASAEIATLTVADAEAIAALENVEAVSPERSGGATLRVGNRDYRTNVQGVWPDFASARGWTLTRGSFINDDDVRGYAPVIVLGATVAGNLFPDQPDPVGEYV